MNKLKKVTIQKSRILILMMLSILLSTVGCSRDDISGSYISLDFLENKAYDSHLGRPLEDRVIWEHTIYGAGDNKHKTTLYSFDPDNLKAVIHESLSSAEQDNYAGIRVLEDKIMLKSREGYRFLDKNLELLGEPVTFPDDLKKELYRLKNANGLYLNHFDISKDGRYVFFTDENERSLFRYDLVTKEQMNLFPEIEIPTSREGGDPRQEEPRKLTYRLYELLLTPNEQFMIAKVAGYREAYQVFNLNNLDGSFLTDYLPVNINWTNVQDFIPMYAGSTDIAADSDLQSLDLTLLDLESNTKTTMSAPLTINLGRDLYRLYAAFNQDFLAFTWFDYDRPKESPDAHASLMVLIDMKNTKISLHIRSKYQLSIVALLNDGRAILKYTSAYGDEGGFVITE